MSVRAYKIITIELEENCSFNLTHDEDLIQAFRNAKADGFYEETEDSRLSITVGTIKEVLKTFKWEKEDYRKIQLEKDIQGFDGMLEDDELIDYECF